MLLEGGTTMLPWILLFSITAFISLFPFLKGFQNSFHRLLRRFSHRDSEVRRPLIQRLPLPIHLFQRLRVFGKGAVRGAEQFLQRPLQINQQAVSL